MSEVTVHLRAVDLASSDVLRHPDSSMPNLRSASRVDRWLRDLMEFLHIEARHSDHSSTHVESVAAQPLLVDHTGHADNAHTENGEVSSVGKPGRVAGGANETRGAAGMTRTIAETMADHGKHTKHHRGRAGPNGHLFVIGSVSPHLNDLADSRYTLETLSLMQRVRVRCEAAEDSLYSVEERDHAAAMAKLRRDARALGMDLDSLSGGAETAAASLPRTDLVIPAFSGTGAKEEGKKEGSEEGAGAGELKEEAKAGGAEVKETRGDNQSGKGTDNTTGTRIQESFGGIQTRLTELDIQRETLRDNRRHRIDASRVQWASLETQSQEAYVLSY